MDPKVRRFVPVARWKRGLMSCRRQMAGMRCDPCRCPAHEMVYSMQREEEALRLRARVHPSQVWLLPPDLEAQRSRCCEIGRGCFLLPAARLPGWPENRQRRMSGRMSQNKNDRPSQFITARYCFMRCSQSMY